MGIVSSASMLVAAVRPSRSLIQSWQSQTAGPRRGVAEGLMRLAGVLRHRAAKAVPAGCLERSSGPALRSRTPSSVMVRASVVVERESTARA